MPEPIPTPIVGHMTKPTDAQPGPFFDRSTTTYKIAPIEITVVKNRESSHVPPPDDCGCQDSGPDYASLAEIVARGAQHVTTPPPPPTVAPDLDMDK